MEIDLRLQLMIFLSLFLSLIQICNILNKEITDIGSLQCRYAGVIWSILLGGYDRFVTKH